MTCDLADKSGEAQVLLAKTWAALPKKLKGPTQFLGRQYVGCGATIGVMPRCDFSCDACYLGKEANYAKPLPIEEIKRQIQRIRQWLGPSGNLQLTDGEITLLPENELVELIAYARNVGLVPMLMTHGEKIRRNPELLHRLMREGGLTEICFHIDTTMCGRRVGYSKAVSEAALNGLREEFAAIIRSARKSTKQKLEAASTVTVTRQNLSGVPGIVRWFLTNADAFKMVSFQPVAPVGRSEFRLGAVTPDELWAHIAEGAGDPLLLRGEGWLGHPACGRFVQGVAVKRRNKPLFVPLYRRNVPKEMRFLNELLNRLGGTSFRLDRKNQAIRKAISIIRQNKLFFVKQGLPYFLNLLRRAGTLKGRYFCIVSHHFMGPAEITTPLGIERRSACIFRVPIRENLTSMCDVNAGGLRTRFYESADKVASPGKGA